MKKMLVAAFVLALAPAAFAKGAMNRQTHHCVVDGKEVAKTHKQCKAAKGKWAKGAPTLTPEAAPAK